MEVGESGIRRLLGGGVRERRQIIGQSRAQGLLVQLLQQFEKGREIVFPALEAIGKIVFLHKRAGRPVQKGRKLRTSLRRKNLDGDPFLNAVLPRKIVDSLVEKPAEKDEA